MITTETVQARLTELARARKQADELNANLKLRRAELDAEIAANETAPSELEASIKADLLDYMQETGDLHIHPLVTFQRRHKLVYDKEEVLASLESEGLSEYVRVKKELDARRFEADFKSGKLAWVNAEEINAPVIAFSGLGELLLLERES